MAAAGGLEAHLEGHTWRLTLARPAVHNALDGALVAALTAALARPPAAARRLLLAGQGPSFSAGADLGWMLGQADAPAQLAALLEAVDRCPLAVIGVAHGRALGGGAGLLCCCDVVVATAQATFGFVEARVGLAPALIAPKVVARIGPAAARRLFTHAETLDAERARDLGLVDLVVPDLAAANALVDGPLARQLAACAPGAVAAAKRVVRAVSAPAAGLGAQLAGELAALAAGPEAAAGVAAFFARRPAPWA